MCGLEEDGLLWKGTWCLENEKKCFGHCPARQKRFTRFVGLQGLLLALADAPLQCLLSWISRLAAALHGCTRTDYSSLYCPLRSHMHRRSCPATGKQGANRVFDTHALHSHFFTKQMKIWTPSPVGDARGVHYGWCAEASGNLSFLYRSVEYHRQWH